MAGHTNNNYPPDRHAKPEPSYCLSRSAELLAVASQPLVARTGKTPVTRTGIPALGTAPAPAAGGDGNNLWRRDAQAVHGGSTASGRVDASPEKGSAEATVHTRSSSRTAKGSSGSGDRSRDSGIRADYMRRMLFASIFVLGAWEASQAQADTGESIQESALPALSFAGFGTFGVVHSSEDNAQFTGSELTPTGAGYGHSWSAGVDSLLAAQVTANVTTKLSAVLQVIAAQNYDDTYTPHMEWANIKYQFTLDFDVRIGRTALPIFMLTDARDVNYASPWVRLPVELYDLVPVTANDGIDATYRKQIGAGTNTIQFTAGGSDTRFPTSDGPGTVHARGLRTFSDTFEEGFATVRLTYGRSRVAITKFDPLFDAFRQFGPQGVAIADRYDVNDRLVNFLGVGASYDPGNWFVMSELGHFATHSLPGDNTGWYVSGGPRLGRLTLFATYAARKVESNRSDPGLTVAALPPTLAAAATELNATLNAQLGSVDIQNTISMGVRWDFIKDMDCKLQVEHTRNGAGSPGMLKDLQPAFRPGGIVNLISATLDFVF
jgi:hypothetical protein